MQIPVWSGTILLIYEYIWIGFQLREEIYFLHNRDEICCSSNIVLCKIGTIHFIPWDCKRNIKFWRRRTISFVCLFVNMLLLKLSYSALRLYVATMNHLIWFVVVHLVRTLSIIISLSLHVPFKQIYEWCYIKTVKKQYYVKNWPS